MNEMSSESESSMEEQSSENDETKDDDTEELPKKFDLRKIKQHMEEGPASSSEDEESEVEDDNDDAMNGSSDDDGGEGQEQLSGWADAMAKVLNTGKNSQSTEPLLLSKAKKDSLTKPDGDASKPIEKAAVRKAKRKEIEEIGRTRPNIVKDRMKEKRLAKMATRGVVQLFNAVRDQQKVLKTQLNKAGLSTFKKDKVYKNLDKDAFLEVLSGKTKESSSSMSKSQTQNGLKKHKTEIKTEDNDGTWSVLKDDYMMGAKMKDWDKESDSD